MHQFTAPSLGGGRSRMSTDSHGWLANRCVSEVPQVTYLPLENRGILILYLTSETASLKRFASESSRSSRLRWPPRTWKTSPLPIIEPSVTALDAITI